MKNLFLSAISISFAVLMLASCKKESDNPTATSLTLKMQAINKTSGLLKSVSLTTPTFTWDSCLIIVSRIEFEAEKHSHEMSDDSTETHLEWIGPKKLDLFSLAPVIGQIDLQPGIFNEISLTIKAFISDAGNSPVFYLTGTYINSSGENIPIQVILNEELSFKIEVEGSSLDGTSDYTSMLKMDLSLLLSEITSSELDIATRSNGTIIINKSSNVLLYDKVKTKISTSIESEFEHGKEIENESGDDSGSGKNSGGNSNSNSGNSNSGSNDGYHY